MDRCNTRYLRTLQKSIFNCRYLLRRKSVLNNMECQKRTLTRMRFSFNNWQTGISFFFFFNDTAPPEISPLPLPDALPIFAQTQGPPPPAGALERNSAGLLRLEPHTHPGRVRGPQAAQHGAQLEPVECVTADARRGPAVRPLERHDPVRHPRPPEPLAQRQHLLVIERSEEHTSELQS